MSVEPLGLPEPDAGGRMSIVTVDSAVEDAVAPSSTAMEPPHGEGKDGVDSPGLLAEGHNSGDEQDNSDNEGDERSFGGFAAVHPDPESLASPSPVRYPRGTKPSRSQMEEEFRARLKEDVGRRQHALLGAAVLNRAGFAMNAWLEPITDEQKQLADAAYKRKLMASRQRSPEDEQLLHTVGRWAYCWQVRCDMVGAAACCCLPGDVVYAPVNQMIGPRDFLTVCAPPFPLRS